MKRPGDGWTKIEWHICPHCGKKGYYQKFASSTFNGRGWFCKYCREFGYAPQKGGYVNTLQLEGLNGRTPIELKKAIAGETQYEINEIRLFGSRISGGWKEDSDLDVAIKDENKTHMGMFHLEFFGLNCEIRFVESFEQSWLWNSI